MKKKRGKHLFLLPSCRRLAEERSPKLIKIMITVKLQKNNIKRTNIISKQDFLIF